MAAELVWEQRTTTIEDARALDETLTRLHVEAQADGLE